MLFNSYEFIFIFLPIALIGYAAIGRRALLPLSIAFYGMFGWEFLLFLTISVVVNFLLAKFRRLFILALVFNIGMLLAAKYAGFFIGRGIVMPLGMSFFTFSQIAYIVNTHRGELDRVSFLDYALYVFYFPKLLMGPITEPKEFFASVDSAGGIKSENLAGGLQLFFFGLFKKVIFADAFSRLVAFGFGNVASLGCLDVCIVALCYTFEIYFDFSGYTDMAIGISKMFGIVLPQNFDSPYLAVSVRDFWKRWHLTLTKFLTKYVYFPLGGSRQGEFRTYMNIMIVFAVSGIWHGSELTFLVWGLIHGILMVRDRRMEHFDSKIPRLVRMCAMFVCTNVLWLLFRSGSVGAFVRMLRRMTCMDGLNPDLLKIVTFPFPLWFLLVAAFVVCFKLPNNSRRAFKANWASLAITACVAIISLCSLGGATYFVYFNF